MRTELIGSLQNRLAKLRATGELADFTDVELLGINYSVTWRNDDERIL